MKDIKQAMRESPEYRKRRLAYPKVKNTPFELINKMREAFAKHAKEQQNAR